jgi:hypothetical protein
MTPVNAPNLDRVLELARQLPPVDQARLVARLTPSIAAALEDTRPISRPSDDPWGIIARLQEEFHALGPVSPSVTEELIASRR